MLVFWDHSRNAFTLNVPLEQGAWALSGLRKAATACGHRVSRREDSQLADLKSMSLGGDSQRKLNSAKAFRAGGGSLSRLQAEERYPT